MGIIYLMVLIIAHLASRFLAENSERVKFDPVADDCPISRDRQHLLRTGINHSEAQFVYARWRVWNNDPPLVLDRFARLPQTGVVVEIEVRAFHQIPDTPRAGHGFAAPDSHCLIRFSVPKINKNAVIEVRWTQCFPIEGQQEWSSWNPRRSANIVAVQ